MLLISLKENYRVYRGSDLRQYRHDYWGAMKMRIRIWIFATVISVASAAASLAQNAVSPSGNSQSKAAGPGPQMNKGTPLLSKDECDQAGGKVVAIAASICGGSTSACSTTDQNGNNHLVCISKR
jgi:hypothetical protein